MITASYKYLADWDRDGSFDHAYSDISAYVFEAEWQFGCPSGPPNPANAGSVQILLDNSTAIFSPSNAASPLYGLIKRDVRLRILMTVGTSEVQQYECLIQAIVPNVGPTVGTSTATLTAVGKLVRFNRGTVDIPMQENVGTGAAAAEIFDADGLAASDYEVDAGQSTLSKFWVKPGDGKLSALRGLELAELGNLAEGRDGKICFRSRAHSFTAPHDVAQATYGTGVLRLWNLRQIDSLAAIYDKVRGSVRVFNKSEESALVTLAAIWNDRGGTPLIVPAASGSPATPGTLTVRFKLGASSPSNFVGTYDWTQIQYEANTAADGGGTDLTDDITHTPADITAVEPTQYLDVTFANPTATPAHLIVLKAYGVAIVEEDSIPIESGTGVNEFPYVNPWATDAIDEKARCDYLLSVYGSGRVRLNFDVKANYDAAHLAEVQERNVGDRIHVTATVLAFGLGVDSDFIVDHIARRVGRDRQDAMTVTCTQVPAIPLSASGTPYTSKTVPVDDNLPKPPDDLWTNSIPNGLQLIFGCGADKWNEDIDLGEFRAKYITPGSSFPEYIDLRTVSEGGTLVHNGTTEYVVTDLHADWSGCQYDLTSGSQGRWYFAFRLRNGMGWSVWSDGNDQPTHVTDYCDTEDAATAVAGPPADWAVTIQQAPTGHAVVVTATRPATNGNRIWGWVVQVKDASTGSWIAIDAGTIYDGSAINHIISNNGSRLTAAGGFGSAAIGDLVLMDVRGSAYDKQYCQWATIKEVGTDYIDIQGRFRPLVTSNLRIKVVTPPWSWASDGYLGATPNAGIYWDSFVEISGEHGDTTSPTFISSPVEIPAAVDLADVQARVWFDNGYSRSDDDTYSGSGATGQGYCIILADAATIQTDAALGGMPPKLFIVSPSTSRTLGNPTNAVCGQEIRWRIINTSGSDIVIALASEFRNGLAFPLHNDGSSPPNYGLKIVDDESSPSVLALSIANNTQAYLGVTYDAVDARFDIQFFRYNYMKAASFPEAWAYWKMEEADYADRVDATGRGRNLSLAASHLWELASWFHGWTALSSESQPDEFQIEFGYWSGSDYTPLATASIEWIGAYAELDPDTIVDSDLTSEFDFSGADLSTLNGASPNPKYIGIRYRRKLSGTWEDWWPWEHYVTNYPIDYTSIKLKFRFFHHTEGSTEYYTFYTAAWINVEGLTAPDHDTLVDIEAGKVGNCAKLPLYYKSPTQSGYNPTPQLWRPELDYASSPDLSENAPFSISFWYKVEDPGKSVDVFEIYFTPSIYLSVAGGNISADIYSWDAAYLEGIDAGACGAWHHMVVTYDGVTLTAYVDNAIVGTSVGATGFSGLEPIHMGDSASGSSPIKYNAWIDESGIWESCLTPTQVAQLYNGGAGWSPY